MSHEGMGVGEVKKKVGWVGEERGESSEKIKRNKNKNKIKYNDNNNNKSNINKIIKINN